MQWEPIIPNMGNFESHPTLSIGHLPFYLSTVTPTLSHIRAMLPSPDHDISPVYLEYIALAYDLHL